MAEIHISLVAEKVAEFGGIFPVTNSLLTTWIVMAIIIVLTYLGTRKLKRIPGYGQSIIEIMIDGLFTLFSSVLGNKTKIFFPILMTLFIFILGMNWAGLLPGVGTIGFRHGEPGHETFLPLLRAGTADLNTTLALAIVSVIVIEISGLRALGLGYLKKFINFSNPINFFVGILEIISEVSRIISFAFRLFGNVFAGEVLLTVIAFFIPILAPLPFLGLELFVGFIQAMVFAMLTAVFISLAVTPAEH